jgi:uncharacterized protein (DUF1330 family)
VLVLYGGRFLVRGGTVTTLEGSHDGRRLVVLEFPSQEAIDLFWNSPEYSALRALRQDAAEVDAWAVDGIAVIA